MSQPVACLTARPVQSAMAPRRPSTVPQIVATVLDSAHNQTCKSPLGDCCSTTPVYPRGLFFRVTSNSGMTHVFAPRQHSQHWVDTTLTFGLWSGCTLRLHALTSFERVTAVVSRPLP